MSNNDSIDEETKRILAEVEPDDSKESKPQKDVKVKEVIKSKEGYQEYEANDDTDLDDSKW